MFEKLIEKKKTTRRRAPNFSENVGFNNLHQVPRACKYISLLCSILRKTHRWCAFFIFNPRFFLDTIETCLLYKNLSTEEEKKICFDTVWKVWKYVDLR